MSTKKRLIVGLIVLSVVSIFGLAKKQEGPNTPGASDKSSQEETVQQKVLSFNLEGFTQKGTKSWEVNGRSAESISEHEIKLNSIIAKSFGDEMDATIVADKGIYNKTMNNVMLEENVTATVISSESFANDFMNTPNPTSSVVSPKNQKGANKKKSKVVVTCDGPAEFDYARNQAAFNKNVKVTGDEGIIYAEKLTLNLESGLLDKGPRK